LISICFSKIAGAPIGSPQFLGSKEESMACALHRYGVTDSGINQDMAAINSSSNSSALMPHPADWGTQQPDNHHREGPWSSAPASRSAKYSQYGNQPIRH
ncbi:MAG: hypothetical protein P8X74_18850, partial [Reinekea sp.]